MAAFDFIQNLPKSKPELETFIESYQAATPHALKAFAAVKAHFTLVQDINEQIIMVETERKLSSRAYDLLKHFDKEVSANGLRDLRRDLLDEISRLRQQL